MGWLDFLSGKSGEKAVDAVINAGDALFFTDEEKSKASMEAYRLKIEWAKSTQGQNVSRRMLAVSITWSYLLLIFLGVGLEIFGHPSADYVFNIAKENLQLPFSLIVGFYFGAQIIGKLKN